MNWQNYSRSISILTLAIAPTFGDLSQVPSFFKTDLTADLISLQFPPSGDRGAPKTTAGGGTRSDDTSCIATQEGDVPLVALMPNRENIGKTTSATPTLYWYVPQTTATAGEFVLTDENNQEVYYTSFALADRPGIVKLAVPAKAELKAGKTYTWSFMVVCDPRYRNRDKYLNGTLEVVDLAPEVSKQLKTVNSLEQAKLYAQSSIWYETFEAIAQLREQNPAEWQELLKSVGLEDLADKPFVDCCTPNP